MKKYILGSLIIFAGFSTILYFSFSIHDNDENARYEQFIQEHYRVFALPIPEKIDFCGEPVPLNRFDVYESFDNELLKNAYWQSNAFQMIKRANRWFPLIEPILKKNNIPDDFKYLALIESNLSNVVSPAGAAGYWQFMKATGDQYNLEINEDVDERYNVAMSTEAACSYLKSAYKRLKSWTLVAASYNMGVAGVASKMDQQQNNNYYDLYLNSETARYVYRILSAKLILEAPKKFGFVLRDKDKYQPLNFKTVAVDSSINNLVDFAISQKVSYKTLKYFNPWLRSNKLINKSKKTYNIQLPDSSYYNYLSVINKLGNTATE